MDMSVPIKCPDYFLDHTQLRNCVLFDDIEDN